MENKIKSPYIRASIYAKHLHYKRGYNKEKLTNTQLAYRSGYNKSIADVVNFEKENKKYKDKKVNNFSQRKYTKNEIDNLFKTLGEIKI